MQFITEFILPKQGRVRTQEWRCAYCCERMVAHVNTAVGNGKQRFKNGCKRCVSRLHQLRTKYNHYKQKSYVRLKQNDPVIARLKNKGWQQGYRGVALGEWINRVAPKLRRALKYGCAICEHQLSLTPRTIASPEALQIDRIDPSLGYTPENIEILCSPCNRQKDNHTLESIIRMAQHIGARYGKTVYVKKLARPITHISIES